MLFFLLFAGFFSGITTVLFGFSGGFFTVPIVAYTLSHGSTCGGQQPMTVAVATSALVMLVTSLLAVLRRQRPDSRSLPGIGSLTLAIAVGAVPGAIAAQAAGSTVIRDGFVLYLGGTLMDCLLRPGFLRVTSVTPKMKGWPAWVGGDHWTAGGVSRGGRQCDDGTVIAASRCVNDTGGSRSQSIDPPDGPDGNLNLLVPCIECRPERQLCPPKSSGLAGWHHADHRRSDRHVGGGALCCMAPRPVTCRVLSLAVRTVYGGDPLCTDPRLAKADQYSGQLLAVIFANSVSV
ncbi:TSUP family transporter [Tatumella saanichensis]|uniref:TSUP family transporter n=1 Tax=Tatumella saanichensis TaxID=480813 RepID=UPI003B97FEEB